MSLVNRLWLTIALTVLSLVLVLSLTGFQLYSLGQQFAQYREQQALSADLNQLKASVLALSRADPLMVSTADQLAAAGEQVRQLKASILPALPADQRGSFEQALTHNWAEFSRQMRSALKIAESSPEDALNIPDEAYKISILPLIERIDQQLDTQRTGLRQVESDMGATIGRLLVAILTPLIIAGSVVVLLQLATARALKERILRMCKAADQIAAGNTSVRLPADGADELSGAARHVNQALEKLLDVMQEVHESALHSEGHSRKVLELSTRVVEQAGQQIRYSEQSSQVVILLSRLAEDILRQTRREVLPDSEMAFWLPARLEETLSEMKRLEGAIRDIGQLGDRIRDTAEANSVLAHEAAQEATKVRRMTDKELIFFRRSDEHYQRLNDQHRDKVSKLARQDGPVTTVPETASGQAQA